MNTTFNKSMFADRLKKQRIHAGYERQSDLATAAGISSQAVSAYEAGERLPSAEVLCSIANALGCTTDYLVQLDNTPFRENAALVKELGLTDRSIEFLREKNKLSGEHGQEEQLAKNALDLVNCIIEYKGFDKFVVAYNHLVFAIYAKAAREAEPNNDEKDAQRMEMRIEAIKHGLMAIDPDEAIAFQIRQIGDMLSEAVLNGTQKRIDERY